MNAGIRLVKNRKDVPVRKVQLPAWFRPLTADAQYKSPYGGRSASKTYTLALWYTIKAAQETRRIACMRQFQNSIGDSVKQTIEWAISQLEYEDYFTIGRKEIWCKRTDSLFMFKGLERMVSSLRGLHDLTDSWIDEAQFAKHEIMKELIPTLTRGETLTQMVFSWNPWRRTNWVWERFIKTPEPDDIIVHTTYRDNPYHSDQTEKERKRWKRVNPNTYVSEWDGRPDDGDASTQVLAYSVLEACLEAYKKGLHLPDEDYSPIDGGLDIADAGKDSNALVIRRGPIIEFVDAWPAAKPGFLTPTAQRADRSLREWDTWQLYYDTGGVGAPMLGELWRASEDSEKAGYDVQYRFVGVGFGDAVAGKNTMFSPGKTNGMFFARRNIQMAWSVRLRANNTVKLLEGEDVDREDCLFINPEIEDLEDYLAELTQPIWRDNPTTGKTEIDKRGRTAMGERLQETDKSPDKFDGTILAFARDSEDGLRAQ